jgi:DNA (cytosine-5)-methyltransferase 1
MAFRYLSLFSGIEAATVAWKPLGWECVGVAEIEPFPCATLKHHYPDVPNLGDVSKVSEEQIAALGRIDLIVGGFPCQDLSVAGKRRGLKDENGEITRSGLFFQAMRLVRIARRRCGTRWLLLENVPGLYSSNQGRDFAAVVAEVVGAEFDVPKSKWQNTGVAVGPDGLLEWSTLDAQWFGVPQRRRRVFALADFGDWTGRPPILFEPESLLGHPPPRREAGQGVAGSLTASAGGCDENDVRDGRLIPYTETAIAHSLRGEGFDASEDGTGRGTPLVPVEVCGTMKACKDSGGWSNSADHAAAGYMIPVAFSCKDYGNDAMNGLSPTLRSMNHSGSHANAGGQVAVAFAENSRSELRLEGGYGDRCGSLSTGGGKAGQGVPMILQSMMVRRLTPRECERLQGFQWLCDPSIPDAWQDEAGRWWSPDYTAIPWRKKPASKCPDGPRYKALGNSFAVPVVRWIGERIQQVQNLLPCDK